MRRLNKYFGIIVFIGLFSVATIGFSARDDQYSAKDKLSDFLLIQSDVGAAESSMEPQISATSTAAPSNSNTDATDAKVTEQSDTKNDAATNKVKVKANSYSVKEGDTYGCIAEKLYGSYEYWPFLAEANNYKTQTGYSEYYLHVGAMLLVPDLVGINFSSSSICSSNK